MSGTMERAQNPQDLEKYKHQDDILAKREWISKIMKERNLDIDAGKEYMKTLNYSEEDIKEILG